MLVFEHGIGAFSVGKDIIVKFEELSPTATGLSVTASTHAVFDYGRSKRATHGVLEALGAEYDETT